MHSKKTQKSKSSGGKSGWKFGSRIYTLIQKEAEMVKRSLGLHGWF